MQPRKNGVAGRDEFGIALNVRHATALKRRWFCVKADAATVFNVASAITVAAACTIPGNRLFHEKRSLLARVQSILFTLFNPLTRITQTRRTSKRFCPYKFGVLTRGHGVEAMRGGDSTNANNNKNMRRHWGVVEGKVVVGQGVVQDLMQKMALE